MGQDISLKQEQIQHILDVSKQIYNKTNDEKCVNYLSFAILSVLKKNIVNVEDFHDFIPHWGKNISNDFSLLCLKHMIENNQLSKIKSERQEIYSVIRDLELYQGRSNILHKIIELSFLKVKKLVEDFVFFPIA